VFHLQVLLLPFTVLNLSPWWLVVLVSLIYSIQAAFEQAGCLASGLALIVYLVLMFGSVNAVPRFCSLNSPV
jgi:hypothetical protein